MAMSYRRIPINCIVERVFVSDQALREAVNNANDRDRLSIHSGCKSANNSNLTAVFENLVLDYCDGAASAACANTPKTNADAKFDPDPQWNANANANANANVNAKNDCSTPERAVSTTSVGEHFVVMSAEAPFADVLALAMQELKYNLTDVLHTIGLIQIKRWKPLLLSAIAESPNATIGEVVGEIANSVTLRIKMITVQPQMLPSWISLLRANAATEQSENGDRERDRTNAYNVNSSGNTSANAFAAFCANDFRSMFGSLTALAAAQQQAAAFGSQHSKAAAFDRCPCPAPDGTSPQGRARQFAGVDLAAEQFLGPLQSLPPSSLAAFMLLQHHAAQQAASLHGDVAPVNPLLLADSVNGAHCNGLRADTIGSELKCVDLTGLRRENGLNFGIVGISSDSGDTKALCNHQQQRLRTSFDTEHEIPLLQRWFSENQHPSRDQMMQYLNILNSLDSRRTRRQLDLTNIIYWFKNSRAAWRRSSRSQPVRNDALPDAAPRRDPNPGTPRPLNDPQPPGHADGGNDSAEISVDSDGEQELPVSDRKSRPDAPQPAAADNNNEANKTDCDTLHSEQLRYTPSNCSDSAPSPSPSASPSLAQRADSQSSSSLPANLDLSKAGNACRPAAAEQARKRTRIFVDPLTEVPYLETWFSQDPHPNMQMIEHYCAHLNTSDYRSKFPKLEPKNIQLWFKNHRSKVKRLCSGGADQLNERDRDRERDRSDTSLANEVA